MSSFTRQGLTARDIIALSGSHSIGQTQYCFTFRGRIYNSGSDIDTAGTRRRSCPTNTAGYANLAPFDLATPKPNQLHNNYFKNLMRKKGLLPSDQVLFSGALMDTIVSDYSRNPVTFSSDFASVMVKMGDIEPFT